MPFAFLLWRPFRTRWPRETVVSNTDERLVELRATGLNHLLYRGRGAGGSTQAESDELKMACFMGLVSYFASIPEVLRVAPFHKPKFLNAVAKAISQSATITDTPLTEAGLDGTGEVIQVRTKVSCANCPCASVADGILP